MGREPLPLLCASNSKIASLMHAIVSVAGWCRVGRNLCADIIILASRDVIAQALPKFLNFIPLQSYRLKSSINLDSYLRCRNLNDIPKVLKVLSSLNHHGEPYLRICKAVMSIEKFQK